MDSILRLQQKAINRGERKPRFKKKWDERPETRERLNNLVVLRNRQSGDSFYRSEAWLRLRYRVLVKNGRRCQACGADGLNIRYHVDHIKPRSRYPELQFSEANLQVLCEACNLGKGNWDATDWSKT